MDHASLKNIVSGIRIWGQCFKTIIFGVYQSLASDNIVCISMPSVSGIHIHIISKCLISVHCVSPGIAG